MNYILVINSGSTSVKYKIFDLKENLIQANSYNNVSDHAAAVKKILHDIRYLSKLAMVGHRFVHGGDKFIAPILLNSKRIKELEEFNSLAPLHNPYNLICAQTMLDYLPKLPQVAVFDTEFFSPLPEIARRYSLPTVLTKKYKIKRYGFHGLSHEFALFEASRRLRKSSKSLNLISCHLGGGWSITAIKKGRPIDTSMGFTPLEGLTMMTRAGNLDSGIIFELLTKLPGEINKAKAEKLYNLLNEKSGLKGLAGVKNYKELLTKVKSGNSQAKFSFNLAIYKLVKYIGAYWAVLGGQVDAIVFTGAIGAGKPVTRQQVMAKLKFLGKVKYLIIEPNEELMIARRVKKVIPPTLKVTEDKKV